MNLIGAKVYYDGSHWIAIPHTECPFKRKCKKRKTDKDETVKQFEKAFNKTPKGKKAKKKEKLLKEFTPLLEQITASTTNENIKVAALSVTDSISLDSNGGDIVCEQVSVNKSINLKAKNGNITGTVTGGWDDFSISCNIKKGECNLPLNKQSGEKSFVADCNNGDINIEFTNR